MEDIQNKLVQAFKKYLIAKDIVKKNTIQILRAEILNQSKKLQKDLTEEEILGIIAKSIKQKKDSIEEFIKANREDLITQTEEEIETLKLYLPQPLEQEELKEIIIKVKDDIGASNMKDIGRLIKEVKSKVGVRADGKTISELVKELLK